MSKIISVLSKRPKFYSFLAILVIVVAGFYYWNLGNKNGGQETLIVKPADFVQTISVSGKVAPAKSVDLGFNRSGQVVAVPVMVGQGVGAGQTIARLESKDAQLALETAKIDLKKMIENNSATNQDGLSKDDEASLSKVNEAFADMDSIFGGVDSILNNYTVSTYKINLPNETARNYFISAQKSYSKTKQNYDLALVSYRKLSLPLNKQQVVDLTESTYSLSQDLSQTVKDTFNFVSYTYDRYDDNNRSTEITTDKNNLLTWRDTTDTIVSNLSTSRNTLKDNSLDIEARKLAIKQKESTYQDYFLSAPFAGVITRLDLKTGEQALAGQTAVSMINSGLFQIESYVPEINIANVKVGNPAKVTLDAYGTDVVFDATVISIDPAETIRDGVSTYKVKLQFLLNDQRIKSGMTANIIITTESRPNVISVPSGALITSGNQKFVQLKTGPQLIRRPVVIGSVGALGQTEILSGLMSGDVVVLNPKTE